MSIDASRADRRHRRFGTPEQGLFRRASEPRVVITPEVVPEAVEEGWFELTRDVLTVDVDR